MIIMMTRLVVVAIRRAGMIVIVVERAPAKHLPDSLTDESAPQLYCRVDAVSSTVERDRIQTGGATRVSHPTDYDILGKIGRAPTVYVYVTSLTAGTSPQCT